MKGYPKWFTANLVNSICFFAFLTGCLLLPTTMDLRLEWSVPWRLEVDHRTWVVAIHVFSGFVLFALLGALWSVHMRLGWRRKQKRLSGALIVIANLVLAVTGIGIFYLADESLIFVDAMTHVGAGLALFALYVVHLLTKAERGGAR